MARARRQLMEPFDFSWWWRMAIVGFFAGEFSGGGLRGFNNFPMGRTRNHPPDISLPSHEQLLQWVPWILLGLLALTVFIVFMLYVHSKFRFILFESVLTGRCRIGESWSRWTWQATHYFLWLLFWQLFLLTVMSLLFGLPAFLAWRAGIFHAPGEHVGLLIAGGAVLLFLFIVVIVSAAVVGLFAKDFLVPVMALEGLGFRDGWRRVGAVLRQEKMQFAGYIGMKILLAIVFGILLGFVAVAFAIFFAIIAVFMFVPLGALIAAKHSILIIAITAALALIMFLLLMFGMALISVPMVVFFQSYSLHFFAARYKPLHDRMFPSAPAQPAGADWLPSPAY